MKNSAEPTPFECAFTKLFTAYTGPIPGSTCNSTQTGIGTLAGSALDASSGRNSPLLYIYGSSHAYFAINNTGAEAVMNSAPATCPGFAKGMLELAGISHLGPALASLVMMKENGSDQLTENINLLRTVVVEAAARNKKANWVQLNPVFKTYDAAMETLIGEGLDLVSGYLGLIAEEKMPLSYETLRDNVLNPTSGPAFNDVMIATFALANLADHYQVLKWLDCVVENADVIPEMVVMVAGSGGRATAGLTLETNSCCNRLEAWANSKGHSLSNRIFLAPIAPQFTVTSPAPSCSATTATPSARPSAPLGWPDISAKVLNMWWQTKVAVKLSAEMFPGFPPQIPLDQNPQPPISEFISHLRYALQNPTQELASCTSGFMLHALLKNGTDPNGIWIPGMNN